MEQISASGFLIRELRQARTAAGMSQGKYSVIPWKGMVRTRPVVPVG
jgi:hypothetical protein